MEGRTEYKPINNVKNFFDQLNKIRGEFNIPRGIDFFDEYLSKCVGLDEISIKLVTDGYTDMDYCYFVLSKNKPLLTRILRLNEDYPGLQVSQVSSLNIGFNLKTNSIIKMNAQALTTHILPKLKKHLLICPEDSLRYQTSANEEKNYLRMLRPIYAEEGISTFETLVTPTNFSNFFTISLAWMGLESIPRAEQVKCELYTVFPKVILNCILDYGNLNSYDNFQYDYSQIECDLEKLQNTNEEAFVCYELSLSTTQYIADNLNKISYGSVHYINDPKKSYISIQIQPKLLVNETFQSLLTDSLQTMPFTLLDYYRVYDHTLPCTTQQMLLQLNDFCDRYFKKFNSKKINKTLTSRQPILIGEYVNCIVHLIDTIKPQTMVKQFSFFKSQSQVRNFNDLTAANFSSIIEINKHVNGALNLHKDVIDFLKSEKVDWYIRCSGITLKSLIAQMTLFPIYLNKLKDITNKTLIVTSPPSLGIHTSRALQAFRS